MDFLIKPRFRPITNAFFFETDSLNALANAQYNDKFGFYQRTFGLYNYMTLTNELTYRLHYMRGTPFVWQTHNNCSWTPTGTLSMDQMEVTPCKVKLNEQHCYDEYFGSAYKAFNAWGPGGVISDAGVNANNQLLQTIMANATLGHRLTLSGGQLHDLSSVTFQDGLETRIEDAYKKTSNACKGWIQLARETATETGKGHLNNNLIRSADISTDGKSWVGDGGRTVVDLYDEATQHASTPTKLVDFIIEGGAPVMNGFMWPIMVVSNSLHKQIYKEWQLQNATASMNQPRITRQEYQVGDGKTTKKVFFIDDTVIIPLSEIGHFDEYVTGTSHFFYLTVSGVIQLGSNFASLPVVDESNVAIMMQVSANAEDYGMHKFLSHGLNAVAINDTDYICGDYVFAEPA